MALAVEALRLRLATLLPSWPPTAPDSRWTLSAVKFTHGQSNPTYLLTWTPPAAAGGDATGGAGAPGGAAVHAPTPRISTPLHLVLRKQPGTVNIASAHAVEREYRVIDALWHGGVVPVPRPVTLDFNPIPLGAAYYLMSRVQGTVHHDPSFPHLAPAQRRAHYAALVNALVAIHQVPLDRCGLPVDTAADAGGRSAGGRVAFFRRQAVRLAEVSRQQALAAPGLAHLDDAVAWFQRHAPPEESTLVHGDYKVDNVMFDDAGRVAAVLDWELVTVGHPLTDVANMVAAHWVPYNPGSGTLCGLGGCDVGWDDTGIPSETELMRMYAAAAGRPYPLPHWPYFKAWWLFKYAVIAQGIAARVARGVASSAVAEAAGAVAPFLMDAAWDVMVGGAPPPSAKL